MFDVDTAPTQSLFGRETCDSDLERTGDSCVEQESKDANCYGCVCADAYTSSSVRLFSIYSGTSSSEGDTADEDADGVTMGGIPFVGAVAIYPFCMAAGAYTLYAYDGDGLSWYGGTIALVVDGAPLMSSHFSNISVNGTSVSIPFQVTDDEASRNTSLVENQAIGGGGGGVYWCVVRSSFAIKLRLQLTFCASAE